VPDKRIRPHVSNHTDQDAAQGRKRIRIAEQRRQQLEHYDDRPRKPRNDVGGALEDAK
jgi:hypothetical protein